MSQLTSRRFGGIPVDPFATARISLTRDEIEREIAAAETKRAMWKDLRGSIDAQLIAAGRSALGPSAKEVALTIRLAQLRGELAQRDAAGCDAQEAA